MAEQYVICPRCGRNIRRISLTCACGAKLPGFWGRVTGWSNRSSDGSWLINAIIAVNVILYLVSLILSRHHGHAMNPLRFLAPDEDALRVLGDTGAVPVLTYGRFWTLLSANYLHGGLLHILFNMMALRQIGPWVCAEYGVSRMFLIYTFSGVAGFITSCFAGVPYTIGASASLCGLIGALFYFGRSRGGQYGAAVSREVTGWLVTLVLFGLVMAGIDNWAHGGGFIGGLALGRLLGYREKRPENVGHRLLGLASMALTLLVLVPHACRALGSRM